MAGHMIQSVPNLDLNLLVGVYVSENNVYIRLVFEPFLSHILKGHRNISSLR